MVKSHPWARCFRGRWTPRVWDRVMLSVLRGHSCSPISWACGNFLLLSYHSPTSISNSLCCYFLCLLEPSRWWTWTSLLLFDGQIITCRQASGKGLIAQVLWSYCLFRKRALSLTRLVTTRKSYGFCLLNYKGMLACFRRFVVGSRAGWSGGWVAERDRCRAEKAAVP